MSAPSGFEYSEHRNGAVVIKHHGKKAVVLRGERAQKFLRRVATRDPQQVMARFTGNYKRSN